MEKRNDIFSKIAYYAFYLGVIIEVLILLVDKSAYINPIEGRLFQITFLLFAVKVCFTRYTLKEYGAIFLFLLLGAASYFITERNEIVRLVMMIAACKGIDMKKCLKLVFYMTLTGCALLILLSLLGIFGKASLTADFGRGGEETRYILGMGHPNALQCMVWALTVLCLYLYGEKMKWYGFILLLIVNGYFFYLTDSKTSLLVAVFTVLYAGIIRLIKNDKFRRFCSWAGVALTAGSVLMSVAIAANAYRVYNFVWHGEWSKPTQFFVYLDRALTGRIRELTATNQMEGTIGTWRLFSNPESIYYFDMGWIRLFYWYGVIPACIFIIVLLALMGYCIRKKDYMAIIMIVSFSVYTVVEAHGISVYFARNYIFFLLGTYWSGAFSLASGRERYWWEVVRERLPGSGI